MSKCSNCKQRAVIVTDKKLCKNHFNQYFEGKVSAAIKKYNLLSKKEKIVVACSGGKDSTVLLYLLKRAGYSVTALAIDEGISGYRDKTLDDLRSFCTANDVSLKIYSYKKQFGTTLDNALKDNPSMVPCRVCGVWRRYLLNQFSRDFDKIATGHNLDDEAQSILMNLVKGHTSLAARLGPITGILKDAHFTPRVKPLYFCPEKEVASYAFLNNLNTSFIECPNARDSFRSKFRDLLNDFEAKHKGSKQRLVENFAKELPVLKSLYKKSAIKYCKQCQAPAGGDVCNACKYKQQIVIAR